MLGFRKTGRGNWGSPQCLTCTIQLRGGTQAAHRGDHGIEKPEKKQTEIIEGRESASGIQFGGRYGGFLDGFGQMLLKVIQKIPMT